MRVWVAAAVCGLAGSVGLAGCSGGAFGPVLTGAGQSTGASGPSSSGAKSAGATLTGKVRGGQAPIQGAHVYLFAANTTGYGGNGLAASASNASISLLTSGTGTTLDTSGGATNGDYYVTTDASGNWTITGDYTCTAGQQVYLYSVGGDPGGGANAAAGLLAALGTCPAGGSFASATPYVVINEVSTIATAYAFAGFATDALHVSSSGTALAQTGIANAFANVTNLEMLSTGVALGRTPANNGTVPQDEINTLANILASCVNTNGAVTGPANATACYTLFTNATADGTSTGAQPEDTATAAINIAHHPGTNVAALYGLAGATPPFGGGLTSAPNDWTVMIYYANVGAPQSLAVDAAGNVWVANGDFPGSVWKLSSTGTFLSGSYGYTGGGIQQAFCIAIDSSGNAWVGSYDGTITELSNSGSFLSGTGGYTGGGTSDPTGIAIDGSGNVWVASYPGSVTELSSSGSILSGSNGFTGGGLADSSGITLDSSGNVWVSDGAAANNVVKLSNSGTVLSGASGFTGGGLADSTGIALDNYGNVWVIDGGSANNVVKLSNSGAVLSGASGFTGGGLDVSHGIALDGAGDAWIVNQYRITELSNSGVFLSGPNGFIGGSPATRVDYPFGIAIDGSGNVWIGNGVYGVSQVIGAAVPVVTPIAVGVKNNMLGTRP